MYRFLTAVCAVTIIGLWGCSAEDKNQAEENMKITVPDEINGWARQGDPEVYDTTTIFDYINGAGEVYLAYNFRDVRVYRYRNPEAADIIVEIFDMVTDDDAYGVFSYSRESEQTGIGRDFERVGGLICFWQAHYYVCVKAEETTDDSRAAVEQLARIIDRGLPQSGNQPDLLDYLPEPGLKKNTIRFLHTYSVLNYHYYLGGDNLLNLDSGTDAVLAEYKQENTYYLLVIRYPSAEKASASWDKFRSGFMPESAENDTLIRLESGLWTGGEVRDDILIVVLDAPDKAAAETLLAGVKAKLQNKRSLTEEN